MSGPTIVTLAVILALLGGFLVGLDIGRKDQDR